MGIISKLLKLALDKTDLTKRALVRQYHGIFVIFLNHKSCINLPHTSFLPQ